MADAMAQGVANSCRSVKAIAAYLQEEVSVETWRKGIPNEDEVNEVAGYVKESWEESPTLTVMRGIFRGRISKEQLDNVVEKLVTFLNGVSSVTSLRDLR